MTQNKDIIQEEINRMRRELQEMQRKLNRLEAMDPNRKARMQMCKWGVCLWQQLNVKRDQTSLSAEVKLPVSKGAGLTAKGRAKYNAKTGSKLKAPAPNPKTKKDAARKKSFCARSSGWTGERGKAARKRWKC